MPVVNNTIFHPDTCKCVVQITYHDGVQVAAEALSACDEHKLQATPGLAGAAAIKKNQIKNGFVS